MTKYLNALVPLYTALNTIQLFLHGTPLDEQAVFDLVASSDGEHVIRWPDGTMCSPDELWEMEWKSDDYEVLGVTDVRSFIR